MVKLSYMLLFLAGFSAVSAAQTAPIPINKPNAADLLQQISKKYAKARYYHIEAVQESETRSDLSHNWSKSITTAIVAPGDRYRFESKAEFGEMLKISNGKTETTYNPATKEYTQQLAPEHGPQESKGAMDAQQMGLYGAIALLKILSNNMNSAPFAQYLTDEELGIGGRTMPCYVIKSKTRYAGGSPDAHGEITFWIDKEKLLVRKQWLHEDGPIVGGYAQSFIEDQTTLYPVMDLDITSIADTFFSFQPPADAELVPQLSDVMHRKDKLAGTQAPSLSLQDANGKNVALQDFHGKPLLLDFWASWCAPCVAALEPLKKLHEETAAQGLTILSIDEDEDAQNALNFFAKHGVSWSNFHDNGEIWRSFHQGGGVPFYVLIDAGGKIVFSKSGAKDAELRAAIAKMGIQLSLNEAKSDQRLEKPIEKAKE